MQTRQRNPKSDMPVIRGGFLRLPNLATIPVDSEAFTTWVTSAAKFAVDSNIAAFVARNESRYGQSGYWYAYRKDEGKTVKRYIGRTDAINARRLFEIAWSFKYSTPAP
jgi:hypothetical protein